LTPLAPALGSKLIPRVGALMLYRHSRTFEEVRRRRSLCPQASASYRVLGRWLPDRRRRRSEATPHRGVVVSTRDAKIGGVGVDPARSVANLPPSGTWRGRERTIRCQSLQSSHPFEEHAMQGIHRRRSGRRLAGISALAFLVFMTAPSLARPQTQTQADGDKSKENTSKENTPSSYDQIAPALLGRESFQAVMARDKADKESVMARQKKLLEERYDLTPRPDGKVTMSRGKPIQVGPTAKLPEGLTWEQLTAMASDEIREKGLFPKGFLPLPHPKHEVGGMVFPLMEIKQFGRLERFDVDFDLPEHFLPEFPPAIYLTTRLDLGDVSQGKVVTEDNFQELFAGILNAKDLEGLRLLVTQFPQQQFNASADRKTDKPDGMRGVSCFDCHVNGHTSGATHLVGDIRPQSHRRRIETTSLRGVNIQRLFGSQRALKSVEDFTEFEQR